MAPVTKRMSDNWFQKEILEKILEVKAKVDESLKLSRDNGIQIELIKVALGLEGNHGRLPQLEQAVVRLDRKQEDDNKEVTKRLVELDVCIDSLKQDGHEAHGRQQFWGMLRSFVGGSAGAALIGYLAKITGLIH